MKYSHVYLGFLPAEGDSFFVKVGKANNPERRQKSYATHCPGGLASMHAVKLESEGAAFAAETRMLSKMHRMAFVVPAGGEWFHVKGEALADLFDLFISEVGEPFRVTGARDNRHSFTLANR